MSFGGVFDRLRGWYAFHAGFGTFTVTFPDMKARRRWLIGKSALLCWRPDNPAKSACFHFYRRRPDGVLAFRAEWRALSFNWRPSWLDKVIDTTGAT